MNCAGLDTAPKKPALHKKPKEKQDVDLGLRDRVYVITGGSRGLGYATAEALVAEGARVVVSARDPGATARAAAALGAGRPPRAGWSARPGRSSAGWTAP